MKRGRAALETAHLFALSLWMGTLATTGAFAGITFRELRQLEPVLPGFAAYPGDHWVIAGGRVMSQAFLLSDFVQLICALVAAVTLAALAIGRRINVRRAAHAIRLFLMAALVVSLLHYLIILAGEMTANLKAFWIAAGSGDVETANEFRARFDQLHPKASARLSLHLGGVGLSLVLGAWAAATPQRDWEESGEGDAGAVTPPAASVKDAPLQEPTLARRPLR